MSSPYVVYGIRIDTTNSHSRDALTYIGGTACEDLVKGSPEWDYLPLFKDIKPCVLVEGHVVTYLDPEDLSRDLSGSAVDIRAENPGDIMIEFPKGGYKFVKDGDYVEIYLTDNPNASDSGYVYHSFSYENEGDCDHFWWGAYSGHVSGSELRSLSGVVPTVYASLTDFRHYAQNIGVGYNTVSFFQMLWIQLLYVMKYGDLDAQSCLGKGYTEAPYLGMTGSTDKLGMCYGSVYDSTEHIKLFGIEDFFGNVLCLTDGFFCDADYNIRTSYPAYNVGYNDTGDGYKFITPTELPEYAHGFVKSTFCSNELGFTIRESGGSPDSFYASHAGLFPECIPYFGGNYCNMNLAGVFRFRASHPASYKCWTLGSRLSYCYKGK